jgi:HK97 family phage major capsid protein
MANETTSSSISELYTEIIQEAIFTFQETSVMRPLVTTYNIAGQGKQIAVPIFPTVSASAVAEGTDLSNTEVNPTETTITASEVGVMTTLTDLARESSSRPIAQDIGRVFGEAIAKKVDTDLVDLFGSFASGNDLGLAGTELTADLLLKAESTLRALNVPRPYYAVFHPKAVFNLKKTLTQAGYSGTATALSSTGENVFGSGFVGNIFGIDVYENANITVDGSDDSVGGVFHPMSLGLAMKMDFKLETQRDASLRATEIVGTVTYGKGVVKDDYGCAVTVDSAL